eukprot:1160110-Pelagomonas_calceolata.AAC.1
MLEHRKKLEGLFLRPFARPFLPWRVLNGSPMTVPPTMPLADAFIHCLHQGDGFSEGFGLLHAASKVGPGAYAVACVIGALGSCILPVRWECVLHLSCRKPIIHFDCAHLEAEQVQGSSNDGFLLLHAATTVRMQILRNASGFCMLPGMQGEKKKKRGNVTRLHSPKRAALHSFAGAFVRAEQAAHRHAQRTSFTHKHTHAHAYAHERTQEPVAKAGFRAMAEELARDINRHANVVLGGARTLEQQPAGSKSGTRSAAAAPPTSASSPATVAAAESASTSVAQGSAASRKVQGTVTTASGLQGEEALDELAAARLHGYGAGLEDLRAPKPLQEACCVSLRPNAAASLTGSMRCCASLTLELTLTDWQPRQAQSSSSAA